MFLKKDSFLNTVTFRLTLWYAVIFGTLSLALFVIIFISLYSTLSRRIDTQLQDDVREVESLCHERGVNNLKPEFDAESLSEGVNRIFFRMLSGDSSVLFSSDLRAWKGIDSVTIPVSRITADKSYFDTISLTGHEDKIRVIYAKVDDGYIIQIGRTLHDDEELMERYRKIIAVTMIPVIACACVVGWLMAKRAMAGVERVTRAANSIGKEDFGLRVQTTGEGKEIADLGRAFNDMLERIENLIKEMKEVTSNVAHDLRSPLTRIRGIAEIALAGQQNIENYQETAGATIEECDRLIELINTMLEITETNAGVVSLVSTDVDMAAILKNAYELFQPVADDKNLHLEIHIPQEPLFVKGDKSKLQRAIANLIDNAIKYTPPGGDIVLTMEKTETQVMISVTDSGVGIREPELPHIFKRFYRGDQSRTSIGNGLGLSLAEAIIRIHRGEIKVESIPSKGSTFTVILPLLTHSD